ncbi:hypothetical protein MNBD_NITROSPIRAE01-1385 [hydrothermal vent metagenome]|uniref:Uncharacterized protein n=1 Tax=hydrothermal vent metagenome TaxID=652676 RepID=A0A3B1DMJ0_9ZZZZ
MIDVIIPIVFPDYRIMLESKKRKFEVPDLIPFVDIFPNEIVVPHSK